MSFPSGPTPEIAFVVGRDQLQEGIQASTTRGIRDCDSSTNGDIARVVTTEQPDETPDTYVLTPGARSALTYSLPSAAAFAAWEFIQGPSPPGHAWLGRRCAHPFEGLWRARGGEYRVSKPPRRHQPPRHGSRHRPPTRRLSIVRLEPALVLLWPCRPPPSRQEVRTLEPGSS